MEYNVSYLVEYKTIRKIEIVVEADSENEAMERVELGEYDEVVNEDEIMSEKLIYKDWASIEAEEI